ncbi:MAG: DUF1854 domain-containing protein [Rhodoferax sp.]
MDNGDFQLERNTFGRLVLTDAIGERYDGVTPVRAFPVSARTEGLSLLHADGHELIWIERLDALPPAVRSLIEEELEAREFTPEILCLQSVSTFSTPSTWEVKTNRGDTQFVLKGEEDIRRLEGSALLITSGQGVHFRVRDILALDATSRRLLGRFL